MVLDLTGKEVKSPAIQNQILDLSHLPNGLYQIRVNTRNGQISNRFMMAR
jgi:hypothetical protein